MAVVSNNSSSHARFHDGMNIIIKNLLDFILPPRCPLCFRPTDLSDPYTLCPSCLSGVTLIGPPLCIKCGIPFASSADESHLCGHCLVAMSSYDTARALLTFSGSIRTAIHAFKYENKTYISKTLLGLMERSPLGLDFHQYDVLVPVPLHRNRLRKRGYNQSLLLSREIGQRYSVPVDDRLLRRVRDSAPQIELMGVEREHNVKGVFSVGGDPTEKTILLVDDVFTTGATVNECARVLRRAGAKRIDIFTIARAV